jgi:predicted lysophospholipase L1 biosynthesis ABC-type transport system permease subunit
MGQDPPWARRAMESLDNARPEIRNVTERAQRFLRLAALAWR